MTTANDILKTAKSYLGVNESNPRFREIINTYNNHKPLALGTKMSPYWEWCACFVSFCFIKNGATNLTGTEISVQRFINKFKAKGIWLGKTNNPKPGDLVTWDWDGGGWSDHIGLVSEVKDGYIITIEGNTNEKVGSNRFKVNDWRISGYARPKYGKSSTTPKVNKSIDQLAEEVIQGVHGDGNDRMASLGSKYQAVQKRVNELLKANDIIEETPKDSEVALKYDGAIITKDVLKTIMDQAKKYDISVKYALTALHFEGLWGTSEVAKLNNNWGGMTMPQGKTSFTRPSGVQVTRGSARPSNEGGYYMKYKSVNDFIIDWFYLLRPNGFYKVSGAKTFDGSVKGMFREGGAKYDYAAIGYKKYLVRMASRLKSIEAQTGPLDRFDSMIAGEEVKHEKIEIIKDDYEVVVNGVKYKLEKQ